MTAPQPTQKRAPNDETEDDDVPLEYNIPTPKAVAQTSPKGTRRVVTPTNEDEIIVDWQADGRVFACMGTQLINDRLEGEQGKRVAEQADELLGEYWCPPDGIPPVAREEVWRSFGVGDFVGSGKTSECSIGVHGERLCPVPTGKAA